MMISESSPPPYTESRTAKHWPLQEFIHIAIVFCAGGSEGTTQTCAHYVGVVAVDDFLLGLYWE